jgi:hypothetical protein
MRRVSGDVLASNPRTDGFDPHATRQGNKEMAYTPVQKASALKALQALRDSDVPSLERGAITDTILSELIDAIDTADGNQDMAFKTLTVYRAKDVPWYEQGAVNDDILRTIVMTVFNAVKVAPPPPAPKVVAAANTKPNA